MLVCRRDKAVQLLGVQIDDPILLNPSILVERKLFAQIKGEARFVDLDKERNICRSRMLPPPKSRPVKTFRALRRPGGIPRDSILSDRPWLAAESTLFKQEAQTQGSACVAAKIRSVRNDPRRRRYLG